MDEFLSGEGFCKESIVVVNHDAAEGQIEGDNGFSVRECLYGGSGHIGVERGVQEEIDRVVE